MNAVDNTTNWMDHHRLALISALLLLIRHHSSSSSGGGGGGSSIFAYREACASLGGITLTLQSSLQPTCMHVLLISLQLNRSYSL